MSQPVAPPPSFLLIRGENIDLEPHSQVGPDGERTGIVLVHIRNAIASATVGMGVAEFDQFIENCQRVRASYTGITVAKSMPGNLNG